MDTLEQLKFELAAREKRINFISKILYVMACFAGAIFLSLSSEIQNGLTNIFVFKASILSFLLPILVCIIIYIFSEGKNLKFKNIYTICELRDYVELKYDDIFFCARTSGLISLICCISGCLFLSFIQNNQIVLKIIFCVSCVCLGGFQCMNNNKTKILKFLNYMCFSLMIVSILLLAGIK